MEPGEEVGWEKKWTVSEAKLARAVSGALIGISTHSD